MPAPERFSGSSAVAQSTIQRLAQSSAVVDRVCLDHDGSAGPYCTSTLPPVSTRNATWSNAEVVYMAINTATGVIARPARTDLDAVHRHVMYGTVWVQIQSALFEVPMRSDGSCNGTHFPRAVGGSVRRSSSLS